MQSAHIRDVPWQSQVQRAVEPLLALAGRCREEVLELRHPRPVVGVVESELTQ